MSAGVPVTIHLSRTAWAAWNAESERTGIPITRILSIAAERSARPAAPLAAFLADRTHRYADDPAYRARVRAERPKGSRIR